MVELQPSKLIMRVRFPLPAPRGLLGDGRSTGRHRHQRQERRKTTIAHIAQSVEHFLGKEEATGSNPVVSTKGRGGALRAATSL